jgi:hypothetical protein
LPECPTGALEIIKRDAEEFDESKVKKLLLRKKIKQSNLSNSKLKNWPCKLRLVQPNVTYLNNAELLIAADCTAFAYHNIQSFIKDKVVLIGCPKLDNTDYTNKITDITKVNNIKSITIIRMEVPCCSGIVYATENAIKNCGKNIDYDVITIGINGEII